eukprot:scaffold776_cov347-Pavlova_lutheri.AAC.20
MRPGIVADAYPHAWLCNTTRCSHRKDPQLRAPRGVPGCKGREEHRSSYQVCCDLRSCRSVCIPGLRLGKLRDGLDSPIAMQKARSMVDDRMSTEGTGRMLGVNDPVLGWVIFGVFTTIWALYFVGQKDLGGDEDDDSGLTL